jgi:hypothetical protein
MGRKDQGAYPAVAVRKEKEGRTHVEPAGKRAKTDPDAGASHCKSGPCKNGIRKSSRKRYNHIMGI